MKNVLNHTSYLRTHAWKLLSGISCACSLHKMVTKSLIITVKSAICTKGHFTLNPCQGSLFGVVGGGGVTCLVILKELWMQMMHLHMLVALVWGVSPRMSYLKSCHWQILGYNVLSCKPSVATSLDDIANKKSSASLGKDHDRLIINEWYNMTVYTSKCKEGLELYTEACIKLSKLSNCTKVQGGPSTCSSTDFKLN
ncbi:hypothetical protein MANES_03G064751v8 [Manihot esculenta]|uniref:Uncharacterized protein n=1 Tax=Manihot esculenta TaxID=3983 RepID=A0ACB7HZI2_MANES|nr:hypothetical protein MANES_03G064751v8 [Manihot esculenta]